MVSELSDTLGQWDGGPAASAERTPRARRPSLYDIPVDDLRSSRDYTSALHAPQSLMSGTAQQSVGCGSRSRSSVRTRRRRPASAASARPNKVAADLQDLKAYQQARDVSNRTAQMLRHLEYVHSDIAATSKRIEWYKRELGSKSAVQDNAAAVQKMKQVVAARIAATKHHEMAVRGAAQATRLRVDELRREKVGVAVVGCVWVGVVP